MARRAGTIVFNGLPPGEFPAPIFDIVLKGRDQTPFEDDHDDDH